MAVQSKLRQDNGGTLLTMTEQGAYICDEEEATGHEEGFRGLLDKLGEEIARND